MRSCIAVVVLLAIAWPCSGTTIQELEARIAVLEAHDHERDGGHGHGHGSGTWEWSGLYELGSGSFSWAFSKNSNGVYGAPDASMRVVVLRAGSMNAGVLDNMHQAAESVMTGASCERVAAGGALAPADRCFELWFDDRQNTTTFTLTVLTPGRFAVYTEHQPSEFDAVMLGAPTGLRAGPRATLTHEAMLHESATHSHAHEHDQDVLVNAALILGAVGTALGLFGLAATVCLWRNHHHRGRPVTSEIVGGVSAIAAASSTSAAASSDKAV